jgi:hypothetical protein
MVSSARLPPASPTLPPTSDEPHVAAARREFVELAAVLRRVIAALNVTSDALERAQLASELRNVQLEIDAYLKRHDGHITSRTRKYLGDASLQIEIRLTAMAARAARHRRPSPRRRPS